MKPKHTSWLSNFDETLFVGDYFTIQRFLAVVRMAPATIKRAEDDEDMRNDVIDESLMNEVVEDEFDSSEDGEVETSAVVEDDSNINLDTEDTAPVTVEERASVDTSKVFGSNGSDFGKEIHLYIGSSDT